MIYPGYFFQRRDHLLHHKYQGDPDKDPVYPRTLCRPWAFPFHLVWVILRNPQPMYPERQSTGPERVADVMNYLLCAGAITLGFLYGAGGTVLAAWLLPRAFMVPIHAFYVCYLPHSSHGQSAYQTYRIVLRNPFTRYLTLYHSYHGLHHLWPTIPWHQYRRTYISRKQELTARGVEILGKAR
jgi:beta-carotene hydroxylase